MQPDPITIIAQYYDPSGKAFQVLVTHGRLVAQKALEAARAVEHLRPDRGLIERAAMLHDIGMLRTYVPKLGCNGTEPYIRHGVIGREMLEEIGLGAEALICERHVGAGISAEEIHRRRLPLPKRDMLPLSVEEQIVCYADKFFSKNGKGKTAEKTVARVLKSLARHGPEQAARFMAWAEMFG